MKLAMAPLAALACGFVIGHGPQDLTDFAPVILGITAIFLIIYMAETEAERMLRHAGRGAQHRLAGR